jgi:hypothetical protein
MGRVEFVCLKKFCDYKRRFLCEKCPRERHFIEHQKYISRVVDILENKYEDVMWPDDPTNLILRIK